MIHSYPKQSIDSLVFRFTQCHSSSMSNHIEVTLEEPSLDCSSVIIFRTTTSIMHRAKKITKIAKFEPVWWNWKELGNGPGGGQAATPDVTKLDTPKASILDFQLHNNIVVPCIMNIHPNFRNLEDASSTKFVESVFKIISRFCFFISIHLLYHLFNFRNSGNLFELHFHRLVLFFIIYAFVCFIIYEYVVFLFFALIACFNFLFIHQYPSIFLDQIIKKLVSYIRFRLLITVSIIKTSVSSRCSNRMSLR